MLSWLTLQLCFQCTRGMVHMGKNIVAKISSINPQIGGADLRDWNAFSTSNVSSPQQNQWNRAFLAEVALLIWGILRKGKYPALLTFTKGEMTLKLDFCIFTSSLYITGNLCKKVRNETWLKVSDNASINFGFQTDASSKSKIQTSGTTSPIITIKFVQKLRSSLKLPCFGFSRGPRFVAFRFPIYDGEIRLFWCHQPLFWMLKGFRMVRVLERFWFT